ncbi:hypothetical protein N9Y91_06985 [Alphaproteobacteria bacterium]|jgi:hypothetical protein|nr:hypothetical protein [Alphaproteobacteria bacterium]
MNGPTKLGNVAGINLYECPVDGDEVPMMFKFGKGYVSTGLYNEPDIDPIEVRQAYDAIKAEIQ